MKTNSDPNDEISHLYNLIRNLSEPCEKLFGWVPEKLTLVIMLPIFIVGVLSSGILAREFTNLFFDIFNLSHPSYNNDTRIILLYITFFSIGFYISGWVLTCGINAIDRRAREKVDEYNKSRIVAINARIKFLESNSSHRKV